MERNSSPKGLLLNVHPESRYILLDAVDMSWKKSTSSGKMGEVQRPAHGSMPGAQFGILIYFYQSQTVNT